MAVVSVGESEMVSAASHWIFSVSYHVRWVVVGCWVAVKYAQMNISAMWRWVCMFVCVVMMSLWMGNWAVVCVDVLIALLTCRGSY